MAIKQIYDTSLPENWSKRLFEEFLYDLPAEHFDKILHVAFTASAEIVNYLKSKATPGAISFRKLNKEIVCAAVCEYFENDDKSNPGNYSLIFTFDPNDIPENANCIGMEVENCHSYFNAAAAKKWHFTWDSDESLVNTIVATFEEIKKWLDDNAKEGEVVGFEYPGVMQARVSIENGVKVYAIEPAAEIKMLVKDDASIEK